VNRAEEELGKLCACARDAAKAGEVRMHALEMSRRLVLLGVTDRSQRPVRLDRNRPQGRTGECERR
jgi:hypothetical protein